MDIEFPDYSWKLADLMFLLEIPLMVQDFTKT